MKISDMIGIALIVLGILMTVMNFFTGRSPIADMQSFEVHEIAPRGATDSL